MSDTITYLDRATVSRLLPTVAEQLDLVERTYLAMANGKVEQPPKLGIHARPDTFSHAMPAYLEDGDVAGVKWVSAYPTNRRKGLPSISGLIILNDADTGRPDTIMDGAEITAVRTAVASGVTIRHFAHAGWNRVAILGYGEQGHQHARVVRELNPDARITVYGGPRLTEQPDGVELAPGPREAVDGSDTVVTAGPMSKEPDPVVATDWLTERCLVVPVDFDAYVTAALVNEADQFVVDDLGQYDQHRSKGSFRGWPDAHRSIGQALQVAPEGHRRVVCNLGVGALDAVIADAVRRRAAEVGAGVPLPR